jgi:hypothetical protein
MPRAKMVGFNSIDSFIPSKSHKIVNAKQQDLTKHTTALGKDEQQKQSESTNVPPYLHGVLYHLRHKISKL